MRNKITCHMLVKNEDRFIWYAIKSVIPYVDKIQITDTGSRDNTVRIIESIKNSKIVLEKRRINSPSDIGLLRQEQLDQTFTDWFWIVDGDEVYSKELCLEISDIIAGEGKNLEGIAVGRYDLLGDIYHYQSETVGSYQLFGKRGHNVIRLINKKNITGLSVKGDYPYEGYYDSRGIELIHHQADKFRFTKGRLWHAMYLTRSSRGSNLTDTLHRHKFKIELGNKIPADVPIPAVFKSERPESVPDVTQKRSVSYEIAASVITPVKMMKRRIFKTTVNL